MEIMELKGVKRQYFSLKMSNFAVEKEEVRMNQETNQETISMAAQPEERLVLRTEGLIKRYGKRTVVNDVSFDVKQGEIVGLLGPNGAGKTTSFYMTTGLIVPNGGHIYLGMPPHWVTSLDSS